ncbi:trypsin-like serine peptidase [Nocardioides kongjuensis]|uniref:Serine protease n=1 Tax=Nocardioides kongjuensis TaxID=349522 RepID=A0A852REZ5_9ACTN|nr:hypothetical protein [Nocardioides kongjuensis]NYD29298.1 hypothetical protein [Nocardioides kongjuensis]
MTTQDAPFSQRELWERDDVPVGDDQRPWGYVTESARLLMPADGAEGEVRLRDAGEQFAGLPVLHADRLLLPGVPGRDANLGEALTRSLAERAEAALVRDRRTPRDARGEIGAPYRPRGVPSGMHPKVVSSLRDTAFGLNARGTRTRLSNHSTIIGGESRSLVYPDAYPYTAVCKLYVYHQATPGGAWIYDSEATGYMIGRSTMMTSGHVQPNAGSGWMIKVVPACWNGQSVFGAGFLSYVSGYWSWNSDSGSDIKICGLYDPIGDRTGYFGYRHYSSSWEDGDYWTMAGYPYDISLASMSHETAIAVRDDDDGDDINVNGSTYDTTQVESDADEASGASGAPLWGWWDDGPYAIGVHHGVEYDGTLFGTETYSCASGGDGFVAAAGWGRSMWG